MRTLTLDRLVTLIAFIAVFAMAARSIGDTDLYWHLATGRYIVETGEIPTTDPFSSTRSGTAWINVQWLPQVGLYLLYQLGGFTALSFLVAALATLAALFVWCTMSGDVFVRAFGLILFAAASALVWTPRPNILTIVLLAALSYILHLYRHKSIDRLWLIPLVFLVWVNAHGGYLIGFVLIGVTLAGDALDRVLGQAGPTCLTWIGMRKLVLVTLVGLAALMVNLYGFDALRLPLVTVGQEASARWIVEWSSPDFHIISEQPMLWLFLLTLLAIGRSGKRADLADVFGVAGFAYLAFLSRRNIGLYAVVVAPIFVRYASTAIDRARAGKPIGARSPGIGWLNVAILGMIALVAALKVVVDLSPKTQAMTERGLVPIDAVNWIAANRLDGAMFNSYNWGGYLLWRLWPDYAVYVDGRADVFGDDFLREYRGVMAALPGFDATLDRANVEWVVIETESLLADALSREPGWREVYRDAQAVVFVRTRS